MAAASGRRVSYLHALTINEGHIRWDRDGVSIIPSPEFLAKNESLNYISNKITLAKMSRFSSVKEDELLCPVRALKLYIKMTKHLRAGSNKLFICYKKNQHNPASKDSISKWIVKTIKVAYSEPNLEGVRAHDVRSLSSSWALFQGTSVQDIMEAASWKSENTFTSFYMRDMCRRAEFGRAVMTAAHAH